MHAGRNFVRTGFYQKPTAVRISAADDDATGYAAAGFLPGRHRSLLQPAPAHASLSARRTRLKSIYDAEIGVREQTGKNDGRRVEEYLQYTGLGRGYSWCASFVCWTLGKAGIDNPKSAWCPALFPASRLIWQRGKGILPSAYAGNNGNAAIRQGGKKPTAGDVFGIWFPEKKRIAHVGFIDKWEGKYVLTVEGNTNQAGSAEGDGVYRRRRLQSAIYQVADFFND